MRIGMMADLYKPHVSGITNYISLNKQHLEKLGHTVYIFTFGDENHQDDETNVIRSPGVPLSDTGFYLSLSYNRQARRLVTSMDVVHVHHPFLSGSLALRYCRPRGIPIVFTNHTRYDLYAQAYLPVLPGVIGDTALQAYLPIFCRSCDLVIAPSPGMRQVLERFGVTSPIDVVPNGVDFTPLRQEIEPIERSKLGFSADDVVLIYVGRLGPEKNLSFLLRSFIGTANAYENTRLILVGDGPERGNLEDLVAAKGASDRVCFTGMVPYEEVYRYLVMADAFVTASVTEVHPLSVIEAMGCGLPVLGIQSPGVGDIVEDGVTGYIVPEEDLAAYTAKMVRLVVDHSTRREMSSNTRQAAQAYDIESTTAMMLERYKRVVSTSAGRKQNVRARFTRWMDYWTR
jgi:1,2-diacylglycerol 3-alpha-glucosyltransferase